MKNENENKNENVFFFFFFRRSRFDLSYNLKFTEDLSRE